MIPKPLNETQVLSRLSYYASSGVEWDAHAVAPLAKGMTLTADQGAWFRTVKERLAAIQHTAEDVNFELVEQVVFPSDAPAASHRQC